MKLRASCDDYSNPIDFFTRNRHSDYPEVVFSSILSNLLDPSCSLPFPRELLIDLVTSCGFPEEYASSCKVTSEYSLGTSGAIDIFIEGDSFSLGIEVKIWDRSAKNNDTADISQLRRYATAIKRKGKEWRLMYIVPTFDSRVCLAEFRAVQPEFQNHLYLASWNSATEEPDDNANIIRESIRDKLEHCKVYLGLNPIAEWIYQGLIDRIPELIEEIPDPGRFPTKAELYKISRLRPIYDLLFTHSKRFPSSRHTTVGVPFGWGDARTSFNNNSLYGIRTTISYYTNIDDKIAQLPSDAVEIEFLQIIFEAKNTEISEFARQRGIDLLEHRSHLNDTGYPEVTVLSIRPNSEFDKDALVELEGYLREAVVELSH